VGGAPGRPVFLTFRQDTNKVSAGRNDACAYRLATFSYLRSTEVDKLPFTAKKSIRLAAEL